MIEKEKLPKILAIMQLPPPIHGVSMMNNIIYNSQLLKSHYCFRTIPLRFSDLDALGKFSAKKVFLVLVCFFRILKELVIFRPNLVYFTLAPAGAAFYRDAMFTFLLKIFKKKILLHIHGQGVKQNVNNYFKKKIYKFVFRKVKIILLSKLLLKDLSVLPINPSDIYFLANGIQPIPESAYRPFRNDPSVPTLLYLSNIVITKGIFVLIDAIKIMIDKGLKFKLVFVGGTVKSIPKNMFLDLITKNELIDFVEYLGPLYGDEKHSIYSSSDIFVFPTYNDAFPLVLLEAMQFALPVISTFEGAIPEIVDDGKTGLLVPKQNAVILAEKLEVLIRDEALRLKYGKNGKKKFDQCYIDKMFEQNLFQIFEENI